MAWLTSYDSTNYIDIEPQTSYAIIDYVSMSGLWFKATTTITTQRYMYTGMTKATAVSCVEAIQDPENGITAKARWNGAGGYDVEVDLYNVSTVYEPVTTSP